MEITCGIFLINIEEDKILICRPTGLEDKWSIPKGIKEDGESELSAAIRELYEETNIDFNDLSILKMSQYDKERYKNKRKKLMPFVVYFSGDLSQFDLKCNSFFKSGKEELPEISGYKWVSIPEAKKVLHDTQKAVLKKITK